MSVEKKTMKLAFSPGSKATKATKAARKARANKLGDYTDQTGWHKGNRPNRGTKPLPSEGWGASKAGKAGHSVSTGRGGGGGSVMAALQTISTEVSDVCAKQMLYPEHAIKSGNVVGAPVGDDEPTHAFHTKTVFNVSAVDEVVGQTASYCRVWIRPYGPAHITHGSSYITDGVVAAEVETEVDTYTHWVTNFDDYRCAAMAVLVHNRSKKDDMNGDVALLNYNPMSAVDSLTSGEMREFPCTNAGVAEGDMWRCAWYPNRTEKDHVWTPVGGTQVGADDTTSIVFDYVGQPTASASAASFEIEVFAVWEARILHENPFIDSKVYNIDHQRFLDKRAELFMAAAPYALERNVLSDGGPWNLVKSVFPSLGKLFKSGKLLSEERLEGLIETVNGAFNLPALGAAVLGTEERVARILLGLRKQAEREALGKLITATDAQLVAIVEDSHAFRRPARSNPVLRGFNSGTVSTN